MHPFGCKFGPIANLDPDYTDYCFLANLISSQQCIVAVFTSTCFLDEHKAFIAQVYRYLTGHLSLFHYQYNSSCY